MKNGFHCIFVLVNYNNADYNYLNQFNLQYNIVK